MSSLAKKIVVGISVLVICYVAAGYMLGKSSNDNAFRALTVYSEVLDKIQQYYVDEANMRAVTNGSLHGLLDSLDPQSAYLSPLEYKDYKEKSAANPPAESGLVLTRRFGYIGVVAVQPDSPAAKIGLRLGDILEKIASFNTSQMAIDQAQLLLKGQPGTTVPLSVIRRGKAEPQEMTITLAKLAPAKLVVEDRLQGDVAYLRVEDFDAGTSKQIREKLVQLQKAGAKKLVLDLRDCASGDDSEGIATAQLFLQSGTITTLKGQTVSAVVSSADPTKVVWSQPVAVLIGNGTAGAAEILASAIADNKRGDTIGDRTYGTASQQKLIGMDDGAALILTVANYFTPANKNIAADGVTPTVEIRPSVDDLLAQASEKETPMPSASVDDPVVKKALDILQGNAAVEKKAA